MAYRDVVLADSPIAYWRLGELSGTTAVNAQGTVTRGGTYTGGINPPTLGVTGLLTGDADTAASFPAADYPIVRVNGVAGLFDTTKSWTIEAWVNHTPDATYRHIFSAAEVSGTYIVAYLLSQSGNLICGRGNVAGADELLAPAISAGVHHIVGTFDGTTLRLYVDGASVGTPTASTRSVPTGTQAGIGAFCANLGATFAGTLDEVAVWGSALTPTQIGVHHAAGASSGPRVDSAVGSEVQTILVTPNETAVGSEVSSTTINATTAKTASDSGIGVEAPTGLVVPFTPSVLPTLTVRIDWNRNGSFADSGDDVSVDVISQDAPITWTRGRSADFSAEAQGAGEFTLRNDAGQYNAGTLLPGLPVHMQTTYLGVTYPLFYGFIERVTPDPRGRTVKVTCYDPLRRYQETDVVVAANSFVQRSARDMRIAILEDFERGTYNLASNPSFETNLNGWDTTTYGGGTLTRVTSDAAPGAGTSCGEYLANAIDNRAIFPIRMAPVFFAGQVYRASVYLRTVSGTQAWTIGLYTDAALIDQSKTVTVTTTWQRFTVTLILPSTVAASKDQGTPVRPTFYIRALAVGTVRLDALMVTRGQSLYPYADTGAGRWPNFVGNGSFDGGALNGWYDGWANLVTNGSFEANTTGWSIAGDAFTTAATSLTRVASGAQFGTARADLVATSGQGTFYAITGTFKAGIQYQASIWAKIGGAGATVAVGIGSQGTPADFAQSAGSGVSSYTRRTVTWTPSADRTDAHLYVVCQSSDRFSLDGAAVFRVDPASASAPAYADTGPGGGGSFVTTRALSATAKYGSQSQSITTPATATAGRVYDFAHIGAYFVAGQPYTASVWINPTSSMPYKVGLAANKGDGTFDEASVTGTATANVWTQVTVTWTPSADRSSSTPFNVVLYVYQTDATARTFLLDGVRVIPGSSADAFEMAHWALDVESDLYAPSASLGGSALSALTQLNGLTLSRHYIKPTLASPWYQYVTSGRVTLPLKLTAETFNDDLNDMTQPDIDRASIINIVPITYTGGTEYYSDETSVTTYGPRPAATISGVAFFPDRTIPDSIGPALLTRYKDPRARPVVTYINRWPSQMQRELDDLVTVTFARLAISGRKYLILSLRITINQGANEWTSVLTLEESAY